MFPISVLLIVLALGAAAPASASLLFVFGSSYGDTGNVKPGDSSRPYPWTRPYGETWPGVPDGRYSNGRVLSDVLGDALQSTPPVSISELNGVVNGSVGVNFAVGGSGVLSAYGYPPISSQIDAFQGVVSSFTPEQLASAVVLYATAGDDYFYYLTVQKAPIEGIYPLTVNVGKQMSEDLIRLYQLGLRKFAVTYLPPTGCLPIATANSSFSSCNDTWSVNVAQPHNARVFKNVLGLRHYFYNGSIVNLDLYTAFTNVQNSHGGLRPCCIGADSSSKCGSVGAGGEPAFTVCPDPNSAFYWDDLFHPTEAGWQAVVNQLQSALGPLR
ncbi:hypothetical protein KP509_17G077800 [Ceratopteris richardii]|uniref:GDSL esterase/lipase n=1 Tax=Ceratopteris richardii TaxID=49495 RepID=A0A8T2SZS7_CERRI|nr:hypothetical protein KP509_17G077800 [Ceratopteris richardii]